MSLAKKNEMINVSSGAIHLSPNDRFLVRKCVKNTNPFGASLLFY